MVSLRHCPYALLGVPIDAQTHTTLFKEAYRTLIKKLHPDTNPESEEAAEQFIKVQEAYETIENPAARAEFEREVTFMPVSAV